MMMSKGAGVLVDSNVIIDIIGRDPIWESWSISTLSQYEGVFVNPLVFAELCYLKPSVLDVEAVLLSLDLGYEELPRDALYLAAQAYKVYRTRGGTKNSPLPDFFIGAHAAAIGVPGVSLICP
jgi:predicted nucleic acid-binding protein